MQLFSKCCALPWKDVYGVAQEVLEVVKSQDDEYYHHLMEALSEKISVGSGASSGIDVYDFAYEILHKDVNKSTKTWKELYKKRRKDWKDRDLEIFADPAIYLRKWISEAFAGIYGGQSLLFLWDYCFMHGWSKKIFYKIALVTLMMIKPWAMKADNHRKMSRVLFDEPSDLYINDLRTALISFKDFADDIKQLVQFNTNIDYYTEPEPELEEDEEKSSVPEGKCVA